MRTPESDLNDHWNTVYKAVRESFDFLVKDVNSQQQRIATVLIANGLIFGFLGAIGNIFISSSPQPPKVSSWVYVGSLVCLALGLLFALRALWPQIDPKKGSNLLHLEPGSIFDKGNSCGTSQNTWQFLKNLAESIKSDANASHHLDIINFRRWYIRAQLIFIGIGTILLVMAWLSRFFGT